MEVFLMVKFAFKSLIERGDVNVGKYARLDHVDNLFFNLGIDTCCTILVYFQKGRI